jgi:hypothetical protein
MNIGVAQTGGTNIGVGQYEASGATILTGVMYMESCWLIFLLLMI